MKKTKSQAFHTGTKYITESHYESVNVNKAVKAQKHISVEQRAKLLEIFLKRNKIVLRKTWSLSSQENGLGVNIKCKTSAFTTISSTTHTSSGFQKGVRPTM
jgi:hypothetical protein